MSENTINHILKSSSDGELLESGSDVIFSSLTVRNDFSNYPSEAKAKLKRTFTLPRNPFRMSTRKKCKVKYSDKENSIVPKMSPNQALLSQVVSASQKSRSKPGFENDKPKLLRTPSIKKVWKKVIKKVSIIVNNKAVCADFDSRKMDFFMSENDLRVPPVKLTFPADKVPGVIGLKNHGNTCFINAILQCLTHTDCLAEYFVMNQYKADLTRRNKLTSKKYGTKGEVTEQLALLLKSVWHCQYEPDISNQFKLIVDKYGAQYCGNNQHDAQEFLMWLLDKVHEDLNTATKKNYKVNKVCQLYISNKSNFSSKSFSRQNSYMVTSYFSITR